MKSDSPAQIPENRVPDWSNMDDEEGTFFEYLGVLRRNIWALLVFAATGVLIAWVVTLLQRPIFRATATLEVQNVNENFMNTRDVSPTVSAGGSFLGQEILTQAKILASQTLLDRVESKLAHDVSGTPETRKSDRGRPSTWFSTPLTPAESLRHARNTFRVRSEDSHRIIEIACESPDAAQAMAFVNAASQEFIEDGLESRWKSSERTAAFLTRQLEGLRERLQKSQNLLQEYARTRNLLFTSEKQNTLQEKLQQLQAELSKAQAERIARQSVHEVAARQSLEGLVQLMNDESLRGLYDELTRLRADMAEQTAVLTDRHPKIRQIKAKVDAVAEALEKAQAALLSKINADYEAAQRREELLAGDYADQTNLVNQQAERAIQYDILKREVETNRQLYDSILQKVKEAGIASAMRASNIRVVDAAKLPVRPTKPVLWKNLTLGFLAGAFLGIPFILLRERADRSVREPGDAALYLGTQELGIIPSAETSFLANAQSRLVLVRNGHHANGHLSNGSEGGKGQVELATLDHTPVAESFRNVLTSILFVVERPSPVGGTVLVIGSANPSEGKSTVVSNLGIAAAQIGRKVLLIDADLHHPRLHKVFGLPNHAGLRDILATVPPLQTVSPPIRETGVHGLFVLPSGLSGSGVLSLFYSRALPTLLDQLRRQFDLILIDTPPILQVPDARVVARHSDGIVFVCRAGRTTRDSLLEARRRLRGDGAHLGGAILNDWQPMSGGRHYSELYYAYSRAESSEPQDNLETVHK